MQAEGQQAVELAEACGREVQPGAGLRRAETCAAEAA
jgi:hypothetical protein